MAKNNIYNPAEGLFTDINGNMNNEKTNFVKEKENHKIKKSKGGRPAAADLIGKETIRTGIILEAELQKYLKIQAAMKEIEMSELIRIILREYKEANPL